MTNDIRQYVRYLNCAQALRMISANGNAAIGQHALATAWTRDLLAKLAQDALTLNAKPR